MSNNYDAVLMISFGGPEKPEDIMPFLRNVVRGRNIPDERLAEAVRHYEAIGGRSPITALTFKQAVGLERTLVKRGYQIPVFVGMRNWHPYLPETISRMADQEIKSVVGVIMAAYQSYSSWDQYKENFVSASQAAGVEMEIKYTPPLFDHPLFIDAVSDNVAECFAEILRDELPKTKLIFTAHSIPTPMADASPYVEQLTTASKLVSDTVGFDDWMLAYQSRSGRPQDPWLEPDICKVIRDLAKEGVRNVVVNPIGFLCDHVEVLFDIGIEAQGAADGAGIRLLRAKTVNYDRKFIDAMADVVIKTLDG